jgi:ionotropic kainate glutamate receptor 2
MAVADLSISKQRQTAVDFTMPFMNLGVTILFTTPKVKPPSLFSFMSPFALEVWIYVIFSFLGVSFTLFIVSR